MTRFVRMLARMAMLGVTAADVATVEADPQPPAGSALLADLSPRARGLAYCPQVITAAASIDEWQACARRSH